MAKRELAQIPYDERSDDQKLEANWLKAGKLFERKDWSACVMRVATAAEISANIYVRQFLQGDHNLPTTYVDSLLRSANGLDGKFNRLIRPAADCRGTWETLKHVKKKIELLHDHRNSIAHAGAFKDQKEARLAIAHGLEIIQALAPNESTKLTLPQIAE